MYKIFLIVGLFISVFVNVSAKECPDGFRDMKFGMVLDSVKNVTDLTHERTDASYGGIDFYSMDYEKMMLGGNELISVQYGFWNDTLACIDIKYRGYYSTIKDALDKKYGAPYQDNKYIKKWWYCLSKNANVLTLKYNKYKNTGVIRIGYAAMHKWYDVWEKKAEENTVEDF